MDKFHDFYTEEQAEFVKRNYTKFTTKQIARKLGKTYNSVKAYKYRNGFKSKEMALKARIQTKNKQKSIGKMKITMHERNFRNLTGKHSIEWENSVLYEMQALIKLVELTDNKTIRTRAKIKLMQLSEIPLHNIYSIDNLWKLEMLSDLNIVNQ